MQKTILNLRMRNQALSLVVLLAFFAICGLAQAQVLVDSPKNQIRPEIKAKVEALQQEVAEKGHSFAVGYNPAMEYTIPQICGLVEPKGWRKHAKFEDMEMYLSASLTSSFDWRGVQGGSTSVKNQGSCGSCWAFSTVAPLETLISLRCGKTEDLSEQYLVSCNQSGWGCQGGWFAHDYHEWLIPTSKGETDMGAVLETNFGYQASNVACNAPHSHPYKITDWKFIGGYAVPSVAAIKQAIQTYGPVSAAVCVGSKFQAYKSGIFDANESCSGTVNHAITLVGWNDDLGTDNGYWILKNSWGTGWGESGYMRIRYGVSKVGYAANYIDFSIGNCPKGTPSGFDTSGAMQISLGTSYTGQTTEGGQRGSVTYGCSGQAEAGPRKFYKVTTTGSGDLSAALIKPSVDLDVFILKGTTPSSCAAFGDSTATFVNAPAGTYYIVVDTKSNTSGGAFSLQVSLAQPLPDLTGTWIQMTPYSSGKTVYTTLKVSNTGNAAAGAFKVGYYLSTDGKTLGQFMGYQSVSSGLAAGKYVYLYPQFSSSTSFSKRYIVAKVDYDGKVVEKDENNNLATGLVSLKSLKR
jgi:C1A family cysteine protease